jgi:hypothetical protein
MNLMSLRCAWRYARRINFVINLFRGIIWVYNELHDAAEWIDRLI